MSARVEATSWGWWCDECGDGSELTYDSEEQATRQAAIHDEENHQ